jgi:hypothetical protein
MSELIYLYRVLYIYIDQLLILSKLLIFFNKAYYQELYILIIEFINVVNLTEW